jgi:hypothetical protein
MYSCCLIGCRQRSLPIAPHTYLVNSLRGLTGVAIVNYSTTLKANAPVGALKKAFDGYVNMG